MLGGVGRSRVGRVGGSRVLDGVGSNRLLGRVVTGVTGGGVR